jgi:nucleoside-diphosphate-sugar epimerase
MNILVTGISGFVGRNLAPYLKKHGHTVYGLGRSGDYTWKNMEAGRLPQIDAIVHLAGKAHDTKNRTEEKVYFEVNRDLTIRLFDYFRSHGEIRTFVYFSSVKAAADKVVGEKLVEDVVPTPKGPYGESKAEAEKYILDILKSDVQANGQQRVYVLRPCMMHGPGNKGNLNLLFKVVKTGMPWPLGAFENHRSFAAIENVCYATESLLVGNVPNGIYNLADDDALSTNELIEVICEALGKKTYIWKFGRGAMTALAKLGDTIHLPLNTERLAKLTENYVVDNSKIKAALGISKMPVSTREGLVFTIQSFQEKR